MLEQIIQWVIGLLQFILGIVIGTILTGVFTWKVIVPNVMKNKEIQELKKILEEAKTALKVLDEFFHSEDWEDLVKLFKEGKELLKEILENQKAT